MWNPHAYVTPKFSEMHSNVRCRLGCGHIFCGGCIDGLHTTTNTCPICRQSTANLSVRIPAMSDVIRSIGQLVGEHPPQSEPEAGRMTLQ